MGRWAFVALLAAFPQDPPAARPLSAAIDDALPSIRGWNLKGPLPRMGDLEFVHRVTRDLTGEAPADEAVRTFVADPAAGKRERLVDELLASPAFGRFWGRRLAEAFLGDLSKIRMERIPGLAPEAAAKVVDRYVAWLGEQVAKDRPYTDIVREMVEARGRADDTPALGYKLASFRGAGYPQEFAMGFSRGVLGVRLYCASCHDHPFDRWTVENYYGMAAFVVREDVRPNPLELRVASTGEMQIERDKDADDRKAMVRLAQGGRARPTFLFGGTAQEGEDRSRALAALVASKANTQLPRALVNRIWGWLFRRALLEPPDDFNLRNKALSPGLLEALVRGFGEGGHSIKTLLRDIMRTRIYQAPDEKGPDPADQFYIRGLYRSSPFARSLPKDLPKFAAPAAWTLETRLPGWPNYYWKVPDKEGKERDAKLFLTRGGTPLGEDFRQFTGGKPTSGKLDGKQPIALAETTGTFWCDRLEGEPQRNFQAIHARLGGSSGWKFALEGPADTVADWRDEFLELLKGIEP